jgi:hypothetical protein
MRNSHLPDAPILVAEIGRRSYKGREIAEGVTKVPAASGTSPSGNPEEPRATGTTQEEIRVRAYELYVKRGRTDGGDLDAWLQA